MRPVTIKDGVGATVHSTTCDYSRNGWLKSINYDGSKVAEYTHNALGLLSQIDFYNGATATGAYDVYAYDTTDPRNFLKTITMHYKDAVGNPASSVVDYTDGNGHPNVDKAGNQLSMGNLADQWTYTYDHAGRIASITPPNPVPEQGLGGDYGYNWLGQLTNPPADPNHLTYNSAGLLSSWPGMYSYLYKESGWPEQVKNPSGSSIVASLGYDSAGFLSEFACEGITTECAWDADGGFLGYAETAGGSETGSVLADPTASVPSVQVDDVSGDTVYYVCDPQGCVVASVSSSGEMDYHSDAAEQVQLSTDSNGRIASTYTHGPDGRIVSTSDPRAVRLPNHSTGSLVGGIGQRVGAGASEVWDSAKRLIAGHQGDWFDRAYAGYQRAYTYPARWLKNSIKLDPSVKTLQSCNPTTAVLCDDPDIAAVVNRVPEAGHAVDEFVSNTVNEFTWTGATMAVGGIAEAAEGAEFYPRSSRGNFRGALSKLTGENPDGFDAHHVFPWKLRNEFWKLGIDVEAPAFGAWWEAGDHARNWRAYNAWWEWWFRKYGAAGDPQDFARWLAKLFGYEIYF